MFWPACMHVQSFLHSIHWLVEGVQSRDISVAMRTVKPHPVSYTQPPNMLRAEQSTGKRGWLVVHALRFNMSRRMGDKIKHLSVADWSSVDKSFVIIMISINQTCYWLPFYFSCTKSSIILTEYGFYCAWKSFLFIYFLVNYYQIIRMHPFQG